MCVGAGKGGSRGVLVIAWCRGLGARGLPPPWSAAGLGAIVLEGTAARACQLVDLSPGAANAGEGGPQDSVRRVCR